MLALLFTVSCRENGTETQETRKADGSAETESTGGTETGRKDGGKTEMTITQKESASDTLLIAEKGSTEYGIVYPAEGVYEKEAAEKLSAALLAVTGCEFPVTADIWVGEGTKPLILVGSTCLPASASFLSECPELTYRIGTDGPLFLIAGTSPKITLFAVSVFLRDHLGYQTPNRHKTAETLRIDSAFDLHGSWIESLPGGKLKTCEDGNNDSFDRPTGEITPENAGQGTAGLTETGKITVDKTSSHTGGAQFIGKLYTEGLSRAPEGEEFLRAYERIEKEGFSVGTLTALARDIFGSDAFFAQKLSDRASVFAVYRAILSRDPDEGEIAKRSGTDPETLAEELTGTAEFASLLPGIKEGPYYWTSDSAEGWTGDTVMTADELKALLKENTTVALKPGTLVLLDQAIVLPKGCVLTTEGSPSSYLNMARLLRAAGVGDNHLVELSDHAELRHVFVDGCFSAWDNHSYGGNGTNVVLQGNGTTVSGCRISNSVSHGTLIAAISTEHHVIENNLITGYANHHDYSWADGISCLAADTLIRNNALVDMTDGVIAVFRYLNPSYQGNYLRAQNTITTGNLLVNLGNSAYAAYDHETVNYGPDGPDYLGEKAINEDPANMTGCVAYDNRFYTSPTAHFHMTATLSTLPWRTERGCDRAFGGAFVNNYTPEGCFCCCGAGIVADKVTDITVRGNQFSFFIGEWHSPSAASSPYAVHARDTAGDLQPGFEDKSVSVFICNLQGGLTLEAAKRYELNGFRLFEEKVTLPASLFVSVP